MGAEGELECYNKGRVPICSIRQGHVSGSPPFDYPTQLVILVHHPYDVLYPTFIQDHVNERNTSQATDRSYYITKYLSLQHGSWRIWNVHEPFPNPATNVHEGFEMYPGNDISSTQRHPTPNPWANWSQLVTWLATPIYDKCFVQVCSWLTTTDTWSLTG